MTTVKIKAADDKIRAIALKIGLKISPIFTFEDADARNMIKLKSATVYFMFPVKTVLVKKSLRHVFKTTLYSICY